MSPAVRSMSSYGTGTSPCSLEQDEITSRHPRQGRAVHSTNEREDPIAEDPPLPAGEEEKVTSASVSPTPGPCPLAVAVVCHVPLASEFERSCRRVALTLRVRGEGYCLVELFEVGVPEEEGVWAVVGELIAREEIRAAFVSGLGPVLPGCLEGVAVVDVPAPGVGSGSDDGSRGPVLLPSADRSAGYQGGGVR